MIVLGIETSCDETAAAVVRDGQEILSSIVASQEAVHGKFGGVVPELASRKHLERIIPVVREAVARAGLDDGDIEAIAVTEGPGLIGALLVGLSFGKAFAYARGIPFIGINHLEGHLTAACLDGGPEADWLPPFTALLVSGGHTNLYRVRDMEDVELLGQSRDDAAGEAFDKVAKLMGLGFPGGIEIERLAEKGDPAAIEFPRPILRDGSFDFSFSGLKTAVAYHLKGLGESVKPSMLCDIAACFQEAVVEVLVQKSLRAIDHTRDRRLAVVGGVAANRRLRNAFAEAARSCRPPLRVHFPSPALCTDNAAMIAAAAEARLRRGLRSPLGLNAYSRVPGLDRHTSRND